jgi:hypothetical protein
VVGLAVAAVHPADQTELVPPSLFSKLTESGILSGLTSRLSLSPVLVEKRPTFAFLRRIRDHPKLSQDALRSQLEVGLSDRYRTVVPKAGDTVAALVEEWVSEWLADARTDADVEKRLEGMVEEIAVGGVIWFAVRGWQARGDRGRTFNADFFVCVYFHQLFSNAAGAHDARAVHILSRPQSSYSHSSFPRIVLPTPFCPSRAASCFSRPTTRLAQHGTFHGEMARSR